jgi:6,7-dimethyl-8-ribityllumazine synthase
MKGKVYEGKLIGKGKKVCIVVARFNDFVTKHLLDAAVETLLQHDVEEENIDIVWTPGSFEIPFVCKKVISTKRYDGVIALGAIIKGDTSHNEYIATEATKGVAQLMLESNIPIAYGIITTENIEQAIERAGTKLGNKGVQAALTLLELMNLKI